MPDSTTQEQTYPLLDGIETPHDLRRLRPDQLPELCAEIRRFMLSTLSVIPGHLGANLGAVEITVAMHYVFDTPEDRIVWDVGHQACQTAPSTERVEVTTTSCEDLVYVGLVPDVPNDAVFGRAGWLSYSLGE